MPRKRMLFAALLAAVTLCIAPMAPRRVGMAQEGAFAKAQNTTSTNLTATLHDHDASGTTLLLLRSDDYNGIGQATYTSSSSRGSSLSSGFDANGEWNL